MGSLEEPLSTRETVLLVVDAAGGEIDGRTAAQKLCYFAAAAIGQDIGHRAHYYGPYSRPVENVLNNSVFAGDLLETTRPVPSGRAYHYKLTDQGTEVVAELKRDHQEQAAKIEETVGQLHELVPRLWQHPLSLAAKVDLIVQQHPGPISLDEIPDLARGLGWDVSDDDVQRATDILVKLDRITVS